MTQWITHWLGVTLLLMMASMDPSYAQDNYMTRYCYCNLDEYLKTTLLSILNEEDVDPYIPETLPPTTTPAPTEAPTNTTEEEEDPADESDLEKRDADDYYYNDDEETVHARSKRTVIEFTERSLFLTDPPSTGIVHPKTGRMVMDDSVQLSNTYGVVFTNSYKPVKCDCNTGAIIKLSVCLTRLPYSKSLNDATLNSTIQAYKPLLEEMDRIMRMDSMLKSNFMYKRVFFDSFTIHVDLLKIDRTSIVFKVYLSKKEFLSGYHVFSALMPALKSEKATSPKKLGDQETMSDCISYEDITPPDPIVRPPLWYLRFLTIPIAVGVMILLCFCVCCKKNDKIYIRFW